MIALSISRQTMRFRASLSKDAVGYWLLIVLVAPCCSSFAPGRPSSSSSDLGRTTASIIQREPSKLWDPARDARLPLTLFATDGSSSKKRKRRRRKDSTADIASPSSPQPPPPARKDPIKDADPVAQGDSVSPVEAFDNIDADISSDEMELSDQDRMQLEDVAAFEFKPKSALEVPSPPDGTTSYDDTVFTTGIQDTDLAQQSDDAIPLPDIKEARRKKQLELEIQRAQEEEQAQRPRIKRSDREAFTKLLEQQPFADADDSFFEEEEYGTVSALLGERAAKFLGIPSGPLQVAHFIGALVIVLMAFVDYPGFPLTNLPTPLRGCLQGGLAVVYGINVVLAGVAALKAGERGQPAPLWMAKTLTVGGLALDQLTQLPTLEEIEKVKAQKGARSLSNRKKQQQR